jgi:hypothetical protein
MDYQFTSKRTCLSFFFLFLRFIYYFKRKVLLLDKNNKEFGSAVRVLGASPSIVKIILMYCHRFWNFEQEQDFCIHSAINIKLITSIFLTNQNVANVYKIMQNS